MQPCRLVDRGSDRLCWSQERTIGVRGVTTDSSLCFAPRSGAPGKRDVPNTSPNDQRPHD